MVLFHENSNDRSAVENQGENGGAICGMNLAPAIFI